MITWECFVFEVKFSGVHRKNSTSADLEYVIGGPIDFPVPLNIPEITQFNQLFLKLSRIFAGATVGRCY